MTLYSMCALYLGVTCYYCCPDVLKAAGATSGRMWKRHMQCGEILDDLGKNWRQRIMTSGQCSIMKGNVEEGTLQK